MNKIGGFVLGVALLAAPLSASAQTYTDAQRTALIAQLQALVVVLTKQIQQILAQRIASSTVPVIGSMPTATTTKTVLPNGQYQYRLPNGTVIFVGDPTNNQNMLTGATFLMGPTGTEPNPIASSTSLIVPSAEQIKADAAKAKQVAQEADPQYWRLLYAQKQLDVDKLIATSTAQVASLQKDYTSCVAIIKSQYQIAPKTCPTTMSTMNTLQANLTQYANQKTQLDLDLRQKLLTLGVVM